MAIIFRLFLFSSLTTWISFRRLTRTKKITTLLQSVARSECLQTIILLLLSKYALNDLTSWLRQNKKMSIVLIIIIIIKCSVSMLDRSKFRVQQMTPRLWKLHFLARIIFEGKIFSLYHYNTTRGSLCACGYARYVLTSSTHIAKPFNHVLLSPVLRFIQKKQFENALITTVRLFLPITDTTTDRVLSGTIFFNPHVNYAIMLSFIGPIIIRLITVCF